MLGFAPLASTTLADDVGAASFTLVVDAASFVATIQDVDINTSANIGTAVFTTTTQPAQFVVTTAFDAGSFAAAGQDAGFRFDAKIIAERGAYITAEQIANKQISKIGGLATFVVTGQASALAYAMPADAASFSLTGQASFFEVTLAAGAGALALTGQAANTNTRFSHGEGSFSITGQDVGLFPVVIVDVDAGVFTLTGQDANLPRNYAFAVEAGSYTLVFPNTDVDRSVTAEVGTFALTGQDAVLIQGRSLIAQRGVFAVVPDEANLIPNLTLPGQTGHFAVTGQAAGFVRFLKINDAATYALTGEIVNLTAGRGRRFEFVDGNTSIILSQVGPNAAIISPTKNEAA
jgi:hypothetical protein